MVAAAAAHADADGADLARIHIHAGCIAPAAGLDAVARQGVDDAVLQRLHQFTHAELAAAQVDERIYHQLAGTVVGDLAAPVYVDHRDVAGGQYVLHLASKSQGEHRRVFQEPDLVRRIGAPLQGELLHGAPGGFVLHLAEMLDDRPRHRAINTRWWALKSR